MLTVSMRTQRGVHRREHARRRVVVARVVVFRRSIHFAAPVTRRCASPGRSIGQAPEGHAEDVAVVRGGDDRDGSPAVDRADRPRDFLHQQGHQPVEVPARVRQRRHPDARRKRSCVVRALRIPTAAARCLLRRTSRRATTTCGGVTHGAPPFDTATTRRYRRRGGARASRACLRTARAWGARSTGRDTCSR